MGEIRAVVTLSSENALMAAKPWVCYGPQPKWRSLTISTGLGPNLTTTTHLAIISSHCFLTFHVGKLLSRWLLKPTIMARLLEIPIADGGQCPLPMFSSKFVWLTVLPRLLGWGRFNA